MSWLLLVGGAALVGAGMLVAHLWARRRASAEAEDARADAVELEIQVKQDQLRGKVSELTSQQLLDEIRGKR